MDSDLFLAADGSNNDLIKPLDVVVANFVRSQKSSWECLFDGFNSLYAITYSSSVDFICKLLKKFDYAEIILGCDDVISNSVCEVFMHQKISVDWLADVSKRQGDLIERMRKRKLRFYTPSPGNRVSHEKFYILCADDGRKRVIMGSANMSNAAFSGSQGEGICCFDCDDDAFNFYLERFETIKNSCTDEINAPMVEIGTDGGIIGLPVSKRIEREKVLSFRDYSQSEMSDKNYEFVLDVKNAAQKIACYFPEPDKEGKIIVDAKKVKSIDKSIKDTVLQEKVVKEKVYPEFIIDVPQKKVTLNGNVLHKFDLNIDAITPDVLSFMEYMSGFDMFYGDISSVKNEYFKFANWFWASPFMPLLRYVAAKQGREVFPYPVFGILFGRSKAGKTSFLMTLLKMMIGEMLKIPSSEFCRRDITKQRQLVRGLPIVIDDLTKNKFRDHAVEVIKDEVFGLLGDGDVHYPAIAITANEDVAPTPEIVRRAVVSRVNVALEHIDALKSSKVKKIQQQIGTAFYSEYLRRMIERMPDLLNELKSDKETSPDIFTVSSEIICDIWGECGELPFYVRKLSWNDYFGVEVLGSHIITLIREAWAINRNAFDIKGNCLSYIVGNFHTANRYIQALPERVKLANQANGQEGIIAMNLDEARQFFGINFRKGLWGMYGKSQ